MSSKENLQLLRQDGGQYIIGERMRSGVPVVEDALSRPRRYHRLKDNLEVKEVVVARAEAAEVRDLPQPRGGGAGPSSEGATAAGARASPAGARPDGHPPASRLRPAHQPALWQVRAAAAGRPAGPEPGRGRPGGPAGCKHLIHTSDQALSTGEVDLGYQQLLQVERGWRDFKEELELRPMFHRQEDRIRAHLLLSLLGFLLIRAAENRAQQTWPRMRQQLQRLVLGDLSGPAGQVSQTSKSTPAKTQLFEALRVPSPLRVWSASSSGKPQAA